MAKKNLIPHAVIATELGLEAALNRYVDLSLSLLQRKARQEKIIAALQAQHEQAICEAETEALGLEAGIQLFCTAHRGMLFPEGSRKSREYGNATVGFRLNPTSVQKLLSKDTWERIATRLDALPWGEPFVEHRLSVNKEELLKHRSELAEAQLSEAGLAFQQGETFFLEPRSDLLAAARKPATEAAAELPGRRPAGRDRHGH